MAPSWRLLAKFDEVELPGPLLKTDVCPCGFCWCGKFSVERSPMAIFQTFISTKARETLKELLDGDGLNGDFDGCVPASTSNGANQDLSGPHASASVVGHASATSEATRKTLESSAQREESLQASALNSQAASTGKTIEENEDTCSSPKNRGSSEINSQTSLPEGENSNSSSSTSNLNSQLSTSSASDDQSSSSLLSELSGHETMNFTKQNNTLDLTCNFCFRREEKEMQSTFRCVRLPQWAAKSECDHCKRASIRSSAADSNLSTSESDESRSDNRWSLMSEETDEFQGDIKNNSLAASSDISSIHQDSLQNTRSNTSAEAEIGKNKVSAGEEPSINHIKTTKPAELEYSQMGEDQAESLPKDMNFGDQNQADQGFSVDEFSQFSSASSEVPENETSSGSQTPVVNSGGCQTADESLGRTSDAMKPDLSKEIPKFILSSVNQEIFNEAENRDHFDMSGAGADLSFKATSPPDVCVHCDAVLSKNQTELGNSTSSNGKYHEVSGPLMYCPNCATCQIDLPNAVVEASGNPVSLTDDSQDADNNGLCDDSRDVVDSPNAKPTSSPKNKRKSFRLSQKSSSAVADESSESSDDDDNADDPPYNKSGSETGDSEETTDDGGYSNDDDNPVAALSQELSDIEEQNESDEDEQTESNPGGSRQQNVRKKAPNAKPKRRRFCCFECGEGFKERKALDQHFREHDSVQPFKCGLCTDRFETRKKYLIHHKTHKDQSGGYSCNQCKYSTQNSGNIIKHLRIHSGEKLYACDDCGKAFKQPVHLTDHKRVHSGERPYTCDECGKAFRKLGNLTDHKRVHSGERPYECDECGKAFRKLGNLTHHNRVHSGERPYECDQCKKSCKRKQDLEKHMRIHSGERPYQCDVCNQTFKQSSALNSHKRIHSGERPYKCDVCKRTFARPNALKDHMRIHSGERPYECPKCAKRFTTESSLQRHQKFVHRKKKAN